jgi:RNA 2',3'-cyclic 3'-phosphodiesterase
VPYNGGMGRIRTFLAVPLPEELRERLTGLQRRMTKTLHDVKWVEKENLHVTLVFLGDVAAEEIPAVCRAAQEACAEVPRFQLNVMGLGCFPSLRRPRILWAGIREGAEELQRVYEGLALRLGLLGYRREDRSYTPHVTLGRVKGDSVGPAVTIELEQHAGFEAGETVVKEVHIFSSEPTRQGSVYHVLGRAQLRSS